MSGEWIKMRHDLPDDPAIVAIALKTGIDEFAVVGRLHWLWSWADKHTVDGNAVSVTPDWIDRKVGCPGFASAMVEVQWLVFDGANVTFPNFDRHNGETAKKRAVTNKRVTEHRELKRSSNAEPNAASVTPVTRTPLQKALPEEEEEEEEEEERAKAKKKQPPAAPAADAKMPDLPEWVDREAWEGFAAMRRRERHPLTPRAAKLVLAELTKLRGLGHDATAVLDQSTRNGWRDVYPLKPGQGKPAAPEVPDYMRGAIL